MVTERQGEGEVAAWQSQLRDKAEVAEAQAEAWVHAMVAMHSGGGWR